MSAHTGRPFVPPVATSAATSSWSTWLISIARTLNLVLRGKLNATASLTLNPSATTTTLTDERIGFYSHVTLEAATASAATARAGGIYVVPGHGSAVVTHPSNAAADQTFSVAILG